MNKLNYNILNIIKLYLLPSRSKMYEIKNKCLKELEMKTDSIYFILDYFKNDNQIGRYHFVKHIYWTFEV
jgi:hypothetical protein